MIKEKLYIAYGSNLNLPQMAHRCPTAKVAGVGALHNFELLFRGSRHAGSPCGSAVATIEPCEGGSVPVLLWKIKPQDEIALDRYEGFPSFYEKQLIDVKLGGCPAQAMVYVMTAGHQLGTPSEFYLNTIKEGYHSAGFDTQILDGFLQSTLERMEQEQAEIEPEPGQSTLFDMRW